MSEQSRNCQKLSPVLVLLMGICVSGCSRAPTLHFTDHAGIAELPELHQSEIREGLRKFFGTAENPRLRIVDPEAEEVEEGEVPPLIEAMDAKHLKHGAKVYNARCAGCHGITGDGAGPAGEHLRPRPRDYRKGVFKFTSTPYGLKPVRHDLVRTIRRGAKGTSMPGFPWMADADLEAVIDYVIYLSQRGEVEDYVTEMAAEYEEEDSIEFFEFWDGMDLAREGWDEAAESVLLPLTAEPAFTEDSVVAGRQIFLSQGCAQCHGINGKGQVEWLNPEFLAAQEKLPPEKRERINLDAWGEPAPAADLTARMLHGGRRSIDIYRRIYTGINGTPMPAFETLFASKPEEVWHVVHYVRHVIEGGDPTAGIPSLPTATETPAETEAPQSDAESSTDSSVTPDDDEDSAIEASDDESVAADEESAGEPSSDESNVDESGTGDTTVDGESQDAGDDVIEPGDDESDAGGDQDASSDAPQDAVESPGDETEPAGTDLLVVTEP